MPRVLAALILAAVLIGLLSWLPPTGDAPPAPSATPSPAGMSRPANELLVELLEGDDSGKLMSVKHLPRVIGFTDLEAVKRVYHRLGRQVIAKLEPQLAGAGPEAKLRLLVQIVAMHHYEGEFQEAQARLKVARELVSSGPLERFKPDIVFLQAIAAMRAGEIANCVMHHGASSCILPLDASAVHQDAAGSRQAIAYLEEYLKLRPREPLARWILNIAYMTLGQYPDGVPAEHRAPPSTFRSELDVGKFVDVGAQAGVNRYCRSGGAIMDDFDGDGLLDVVESSHDQEVAPVLFRNRGDGRFDTMDAHGLEGQYGSLTIMQTDYNNDGALDVWFTRGGWEPIGVRHTLLRNNLDGTFTDVTFAAGLKFPMSSQCSAWADIDRDGWLDVFCGGEQERNRLYRNRGDGTFEEIGMPAGVAGFAGERPGQVLAKGANFADFDRDGWPDLVVNNRGAPPHLYRNNRNRTFTDVAAAMGVKAPENGFPCWFWDYDNDGWPDLYISEFGPGGGEAAKALMGEPHHLDTGRLYRNRGGAGFEDVTKAVGFDKVMLPMGSNFLDIDNDGFLDCYLGTGAPAYSMLLPNRMWKNVEGKKFVDVSYSSGTAHIQKGHQVACGDYDRDGDVDIFIQLGGAVPGDRFSDALFQNPGHGNRSVTLQLRGTLGNRAAIGALVVATTSEPARTIVRQITSGGSFGANALETTLGLGRAAKLAQVEVTWPASGAKQVLRDVPAGATVRIAEARAE